MQLSNSGRVTVLGDGLDEKNAITEEKPSARG